MSSVRGDLARLSESAPASSGAGSGSFSMLNQWVNSILQPTGQSEIMAEALKSAAVLAGGAALFVRRGDNFTTWRSEGLSAESTNALRAVTASSAQPGAFKDICDNQAAVCQSRSSQAWPSGLDAIISSGQKSSEICLLPVRVGGKVVAAIVASAANGSDAFAGLEIIARVTGLSLETSGTRTQAPQKAAEPKPVAAESLPQPLPQPTPQPAPSVPLSPMAPPMAAPTHGTFGESAQGPAMASTQTPPPDVETLPEDEKESHRKAHRFARVAVQDLLSYHKGKIAEGRNNRNLYSVLHEDIEKTRENYQKKFAQTAAGSFDYLHYELVAKLAGNDPAVLGEQHPGPVSN
ncbi:MAG: hypothetical protein EXQ56_06935 [Acidobacteria bacterium]|nr:hypothetical protein [Acidobacteriota bacterium]